MTTVHAALMTANAGEPLQAIRVQLRMNGKQPEKLVFALGGALHKSLAQPLIVT